MLIGLKALYNVCNTEFLCYIHVFTRQVCLGNFQFRESHLVGIFDRGYLSANVKQVDDRVG